MNFQERNPRNRIHRSLYFMTTERSGGAYFWNGLMRCGSGHLEVEMPKIIRKIYFGCLRISNIKKNLIQDCELWDVKRTLKYQDSEIVKEQYLKCCSIKTFEPRFLSIDLTSSEELIPLELLCYLFNSLQQPKSMDVWCKDQTTFILRITNWRESLYWRT